jgi:hypothetical protein
MTDNLSIHILWNLAREAHSNANNLLRVERRQTAQNLVRTRSHSLAIVHSSSPIQTYLGLFKISVLINTNCATIHKIFKCGPYANKKSHNCKTSGNGGVQADIVRTEANA